MIRLFNTYISPKSGEKLQKLLLEGRVSSGKKSFEFEKKLQKKFGWKFCKTVNSGTSALHLALKILNIGSGDEVIIPSQTFVATGLAVLYTGAKVVFADVILENGNICPQEIKKKITPLTKAIIAVHWGGEPSDLSQIKKICIENKIFLVDDCAHALGSKYQNKYIGSKFSDLSCFSFQAIKHITCGDGGAIVTRNEYYSKKISKKRWFGIDRDFDKLGNDGERSYNLKEIGFKYHLSDLNAVLGIENLVNIEKRLEKRRKIAKTYDENFSNFSDLQLLKNSKENNSSYWLYGMRLRSRNNFINFMKSNGIETSIVHRGIDRNEIFGSKEDLPNQRILDDTLVHIPIHDNLNNDEVWKIIETIKKGW